MMPNIVKGKGITGALAYAMGQGNDAQTGKRLELAEGETSRAIILGGQNFGFDIDTPERLELARRVMEWQGLPENQAGKTRKLDLDCFHASLSWGDGQNPSREEMLEAGHSFLKSVGLEKARAVFIAHNDTDHAHIHIVASRIDPETGRSLRMDYDKIAGHKWALDWERAHGQERTQGKNLHALIDAVQQRDAGAVLSYLTQGKSTFQAWEVGRALRYGGLEGDEAAKFKADILAQPNVLSLSDTGEAKAKRYTTLEVYAEETALQRTAARLAKDTSHGLMAERTDRVAAAFTLKPEQAEALRHLTGEEGLAILWGQAGTGKSHTLKATRAAYEAAGQTVIGLSSTNDVVQQMRGDGFTHASTITREMNALDKGRTNWTRDTVVIVDEAAMVSTAQLARVMGAAERAGAKLILAGDDKQLSSIERGGMFETLREQHGAGVLKEVQRVGEAEQKAAFNDMHKGGEGYLKALRTFEKRGNIHWTTRQSDTLKEMAAWYTAGLEATPEKRRFMFACTNADVATLNQHARQLHKARGDLGDDHTIKTATGAQEFATGDRIQLTANGWTQDERNAGLTNGRVGTIAALAILEDGRARLTVDLDTAKGAHPQRVKFTVGEDARAGEYNGIKHGYAGTIYKGQGKTLDEVYVGHSAQWRSSSAYVALTRHREDVHIFAARETVKDIEAMAQGMARSDGKRAATAYQIDAAQLGGLEDAISALADRPLPAIGETLDQQTPALREATVAGIDASAGNEASEEAQTDAPREGGREAGRVAMHAASQFAGAALSALLFETPAPPPQESEPAAPAAPKRKSRAAKIREFRESQDQQRKAAIQAAARSLGASEAMTPEELQREKEAQEKRSRDRGGGQSL